MINEEKLSEAKAKLLDIPYISLDTTSFSPQAINLVPRAVAERFSIIPFLYNPETKTYHPSIIHDKKLGGCGWHGWLINGIFKEC